MPCNSKTLPIDKFTPPLAGHCATAISTLCLTTTTIPERSSTLSMYIYSYIYIGTEWVNKWLELDSFDKDGNNDPDELNKIKTDKCSTSSSALWKYSKDAHEGLGSLLNQKKIVWGKPFVRVGCEERRLSGRRRWNEAEGREQWGGGGQGSGKESWRWKNSWLGPLSEQLYMFQTI